MSLKNFVSYGDAETILTSYANEISDKVDKVTGKGLSTEDYTPAEKTKLAGIDEYASSVGKNVEGVRFIIDGTSYTAQEGAEIFNCYGPFSCIAIGYYSHAEGDHNFAFGNYSHVEGHETRAGSACQHVQGKYNVVDSNSKYAFIIGNGESNIVRSNAFAIDWDGLIYINNSATGVNVSALASRVSALETTVGNINTILEEVL